MDIIDNSKRNQVESNLEKIETEDEFDVVDDKAILGRVSGMCNHGKAAVTGKEGMLPCTIATQYQLKSVHAVFRHGDRTPLRASKLDKNSAQQTEFWNSRCHNAGGHQRKEVARYYKEADERVQIEFLKVQTQRQQPLSHATAVCNYGQLTNAGVEQLLKLGSFFQDMYINHLKLIKSEHIHQQVKIRSTMVRRTQQSAAAFTFRFLSKFDFDRKIAILAGKDTWFRDSKDQPDIHCGKMNRIWKESKNEKKMIPKLRRIDAIISELMPIFNKSRIQMGTLPSIADDFITRICHESELPCGPSSCMTKRQLAQVIHNLDLVTEIDHKPIAPLAMYPMLKRMQQNMDRITKNSTNAIKFSLMFGHDSTISPLLYALNIHDGKWPRYAARVVFELWQSLKKKSEYFIRVLYNGDVVTSKLQFCSHSNMDQLCPYNSFEDFMNGNILIQKYGNDYQKICQE